MTVRLRSGGMVNVRESGLIEYRVGKRVFRHCEFVGDFEAAKQFVRGSAWGRDAVYIIEK